MHVRWHVSMHVCRHVRWQLGMSFGVLVDFSVDPQVGSTVE